VNRRELKCLGKRAAARGRRAYPVINPGKASLGRHIRGGRWQRDLGPWSDFSVAQERCTCGNLDGSTSAAGKRNQPDWRAISWTREQGIDWTAGRTPNSIFRAGHVYASFRLGQSLPRRNIEGQHRCAGNSPLARSAVRSSTDAEIQLEALIRAGRPCFRTTVRYHNRSRCLASRIKEWTGVQSQ